MFADPPHIDVEIAQPDDQFGEAWLQGLHLTAKNRPRGIRVGLGGSRELARQ
jgi:hypothetical protein